MELRTEMENDLLKLVQQWIIEQELQTIPQEPQLFLVSIKFISTYIYWAPARYRHFAWYYKGVKGQRDSLLYKSF